MPKTPYYVKNIAGNTLKSACIQHPDRFSEIHTCSTVLRDNPPEEWIQVCACCDECRALCLTIPHGSHGSTPDEEWGEKYCKICGADVSRWR